MGPQRQRLERCDHVLRNADSFQKMEEARQGFPPRDSRECGPADTLMVDLILKLILDFWFQIVNEYISIV